MEQQKLNDARVTARKINNIRGEGEGKALANKYLLKHNLILI